MPLFSHDGFGSLRIMTGIMTGIVSFTQLLLSTIYYRPYVYLFFCIFLYFAIPLFTLRTTLVFTLIGFTTAFLCEYSSTRNGFPFGYYEYFQSTRNRELWISNIPFWDSLSFVFLAFFCFILASALFTPPKEFKSNHNRWSGFYHRLTPWIGALLMTLLDVVIDPVALQGEKWFLGKLYHYPIPGPYYGVTLENFAGWFFVGFTIQWLFQRYLNLESRFKQSTKSKMPNQRLLQGVFAVYIGVFLFNLTVTLFIKDYRLAASSTTVIVCVTSAVYLVLRNKL